MKFRCLTCGKVFTNPIIDRDHQHLEYFGAPCDMEEVSLLCPECGEEDVHEDEYEEFCEDLEEATTEQEMYDESELKFVRHRYSKSYFKDKIDELTEELKEISGDIVLAQEQVSIRREKIRQLRSMI